MKDNHVKRLLSSGGMAIGSEISRLRAPDVARIYAVAGFDFVFIDMEHTCFSLETVADMIQAARQADIVPLVRVPQAEYAYVARVLDAGAQGVIVPRVNTAQEVEQIVSWVRYPPDGVRGFACTTAQTDGQPPDIDAFIETANRETLLVIQIERREAVENLEGHAGDRRRRRGLSGVYGSHGRHGNRRPIGPSPGRGAVERLIEVANASRVAPGIIAPEMATVSSWIARGMRFVSYATDEILLQRAAAAAVDSLRALPAGSANGRSQTTTVPSASTVANPQSPAPSTSPLLRRR